MLLPYTTLTYYGEGAAASFPADAIGVLSADIQGLSKAQSTITAQGIVSNAKATRLKNSPATLTGQGLITNALPKARARVLSTIKVNELSQDDVTGAVLEAKVEGGLSLKQALRILLAHAAGNATGLEGSTPVFKSAVDNTKTRIAGTYTSGTRTVSTLDGS
jgi:hypothetical protein